MLICSISDDWIIEGKPERLLQRPCLPNTFIPFPVSEPLEGLQLSLLFYGNWVLVRFHHHPVWETHLFSFIREAIFWFLTQCCSYTFFVTYAVISVSMMWLDLEPKNSWRARCADSGWDKTIVSLRKKEHQEHCLKWLMWVVNKKHPVLNCVELKQRTVYYRRCGEISITISNRNEMFVPQGVFSWEAAVLEVNSKYLELFKDDKGTF